MFYLFLMQDLLQLPSDSGSWEILVAVMANRMLRLTMGGKALAKTAGASAVSGGVKTLPDKGGQGKVAGKPGGPGGKGKKKK